MNDFFTLIVYYWEAKHLLFMVGGWGMCSVLLFVWGKLWNKGWSAANIGVLLLCAFIVMLPTVFVIRADASERILAKGPRFFERNIDRPIDKEVYRILDKLAKRSSGMDAFRSEAIPHYAEKLVEEHAHRYLSVHTELPVDFSLSDKARKQLDECYRHRNTAEGEKAADWETIHQEAVRYLCQAQFEQNEAKLRAYRGFSSIPVYCFILLVILIMTARLAYQDIDRKYCYPHQ